MRQSISLKVSVALPVFNEEANLSTLLDFLLAEIDVEQIFAVDDLSTDSSLAILKDYAARYRQVVVLQNSQRSGQLAGWLSAAQRSKSDIMSFIDADSCPQSGAIAKLARAVRVGYVAASGRVVPAAHAAIRPSSRFRAAVIHSVRELGFPKETIIGRFFCVRRSWFTSAVKRTDVIASDAYLGCLAKCEGKAVFYEPQAICYFTEAMTIQELAAQRQRADAGYAQLRAMGLLQRENEPASRDYINCLALNIANDPVGSMAWMYEQLLAHFFRGAYRAEGRDEGAWGTQASTKQNLKM